KPDTGGSGPFIVNELGWVDSYALEDGPSGRGLLPPGHEIVTLAGGVDQIFALTWGVPLPGKRWDPLPDSYTTSAKAPATAPASAATAPTTAPTTLPAPEV